MKADWVQVVWGIVKIVVTVLVSLGVFSWLRKKVLESKTVQKYHLEGLVNRVFDWIVRSAEVWGKNTGQDGYAQRAFAIEKARKQFPDMSQDEIEARVDAAYLKMKAEKTAVEALKVPTPKVKDS